jgi:SpoIIAA-like
MPVKQELRDNGRILQVTFTDPWTVKEMTDHFPEAQQYYDSATHKIHMLIDMQSRVGTQGALRARHAPGLVHRNSGFIAVAGANALARTLGETVFRLARFDRAKFFDNQEAALAYLRQLIASEETVTTQPS